MVAADSSSQSLSTAVPVLRHQARALASQKTLATSYYPRRTSAEAPEPLIRSHCNQTPMLQLLCLWTGIDIVSQPIRKSRAHSCNWDRLDQWSLRCSKTDSSCSCCSLRRGLALRRRWDPPQRWRRNCSALWRGRLQMCNGRD